MLKKQEYYAKMIQYQEMTAVRRINDAYCNEDEFNNIKNELVQCVESGLKYLTTSIQADGLACIRAGALVSRRVLPFRVQKWVPFCNQLEGLLEKLKNGDCIDEEDYVDTYLACSLVGRIILPVKIAMMQLCGKNGQ